MPKYDVLSPDGISLHPLDTYKSKQKAFDKFYEWKKRFEKQGYYSSRGSRISLEELSKYCTLVIMEKGETILTGTKVNLFQEMQSCSVPVRTTEAIAKELVGDGRRPNKFFVTIGYGWYKPHNQEEMFQLKHSIQPVTIVVESEEQAQMIFDSIKLNTSKKITSSTIGEVIIEDRLTGVVKQKFLVENPNGSLTVDFIF